MGLVVGKSRKLKKNMIRVNKMVHNFSQLGHIVRGRSNRRGGTDRRVGADGKVPMVTARADISFQS